MGEEILDLWQQLGISKEHQVGTIRPAASLEALHQGAVAALSLARHLTWQQLAGMRCPQPVSFSASFLPKPAGEA